VSFYWQDKLKTTTIKICVYYLLQRQKGSLEMGSLHEE